MRLAMVSQSVPVKHFFQYTKSLLFDVDDETNLNFIRSLQNCNKTKPQFSPSCTKSTSVEDIFFIFNHFLYHYNYFGRCVILVLIHQKQL